MAKTKAGIVAFFNEKEWEDTVLYSFKLRDDDTFYSCGEWNPELEKDMEIEFEYRQKNGKSYVEEDSVEVSGKAEPQARSKPRSSSSRRAGSPVGGRKGGSADDKMSKDDWAKKDGQIRYAGALNTAIALLAAEQAAGKNPIKAQKGAVFSDLILAYVMKRADDIWLSIVEAPDRLAGATPSFKDLEQPEDLEEEKPTRSRRKTRRVEDEDDADDQEDSDDEGDEFDDD